jgi:hypothetical protein
MPDNWLASERSLACGEARGDCRGALREKHSSWGAAVSQAVAHPKSHALSQGRCRICSPIAPNKNSPCTPNGCHGRGVHPNCSSGKLDTPTKSRSVRRGLTPWMSCGRRTLCCKIWVAENGRLLAAGRRRSQPGREVQSMPRRQELMAGGLFSECGRPLFGGN